MAEEWISSCHGFYLTYAVDSRKTFEDSHPFCPPNFIQLISEVKGISVFAEIPMIIVGTKSDLLRQRQVFPSEGKELAQTYTCPWIETSAQGKVNIEESFHILIEEVLKRRARITI